MSDGSGQPGFSAEVLVSDRQSLPLDLEELADLARTTLSEEGLGRVELSVSFVEDAEIEDLHVRYMGEPGATDVLSFPLDDEEHDGVRVLGDVVIAPAV